MPAILTHHLFGEDASAQLPEYLLTSQEEMLAFLLGNQGPDPLLARFTCLPPTASACRCAARAIHHRSPTEFLCSLREHAAWFDDGDQGIARAFTLGVGAHYLLDSMTHPLVLAQVDQIIAIDPTLEAARREIHALIEADIDSWLLHQKRDKTVLDIPASAVLVSTKTIDRIVSILVAQACADVFGIELGQGEYARAVRDYRIVYRIVDPPAQGLPYSLRRIELLKREFSHVEALRHAVSTSDECAAANLHHMLWRNPFTGEASIASFADLFHDALLAWPTFAQRLASGDSRRLGNMIDDVNYYGKA